MSQGQSQCRSGRQCGSARGYILAEFHVSVGLEYGRGHIGLAESGVGLRGPILQLTLHQQTPYLVSPTVQ